jgi:hypothetical protein
MRNGLQGLSIAFLAWIDQMHEGALEVEGGGFVAVSMSTSPLVSRSVIL